MKTTAFLFALALSSFYLLPLTSAAAAEGDRVALVIGIDDYDHLPSHAQLEVAVQDARLISETLKSVSPRFEVTLLTNVKQDDAEEALDEFVDKAEDAECALVYFAGHGVEYHGENFLLTSDTSVDKLTDDVRRMKRRLGNEALALQAVVDDLEATRARVKLVIVDACRDNPLEVETAGGTRSLVGAQGGLAQVSAPSGMLVAYSADAGQQANDGLFTPVLAKNLKRPGISLIEVFAATREQVVAKSTELAAAQRGVRHEPADYNKLNVAGTKFVFMRGEPGSLPGKPMPQSALAPAAPQIGSDGQPFINSLGMRFVAVKGTKVMFSVWETRVRDYNAYAGENSGVNGEWKDFEFFGHAQNPDHPVVNVNWDDATAFCAWLTRKERTAGTIGPGDAYRLPTDAEWSHAAGIGEHEDADASPESKSGKIAGVYPWGKTWPPPSRTANLLSLDFKESRHPPIPGYSDDWAFTAPAGLFRPNETGIFDLGGNVSEWCEDFHSPNSPSRVVRGGNWNSSRPEDLLSSTRSSNQSFSRFAATGFRVVLQPSFRSASAGHLPAANLRNRSGEPGKFVLITNSDDPFWDEVGEGASERSRETGSTFTLNKIQSHTAGQLDALEGIASTDFTGVAISVIEADKLTAMLNETGKRVPLITVDTDAPESERHSFIAVDNYEAGRAAGRLVEEALPDGGSVMLFAGKVSLQNSKERRQGLIDELLAREPDRGRFDPLGQVIEGNGYRILGTMEDLFDRTKAVDQALSTLENPELDAMVGLFSYNTPAILDALGKADKIGDVQVVGFEKTDETLMAISSGAVHGIVVAPDPRRMGALIVDTLFDLQNGGTPRERIAAPFSLIRKKDLAATDAGTER